MIYKILKNPIPMTRYLLQMVVIELNLTYLKRLSQASILFIVLEVMRKKIHLHGF
jgi:hypothetical protein